MSARYVGACAGQLGDLTPDETIELRRLHSLAPAKPPWTPERKAAHAARDSYVLWLYEDGCSHRAIGEVLGLGDLAGNCIAGVAAMLRRARGRGEGAGSRRYIPIPPPPRRGWRGLTAADQRTLADAYRRCPVYRRTPTIRRCPTPELIAVVCDLRRRDASLQAIADVLGVTRERVRQIEAAALTEAHPA